MELDAKGLEAAVKKTPFQSYDLACEIIRAYLSATGEAQCCMCGKTGLSTVEGDGGPECQLNDGRWTCSADCYYRAADMLDPATGEAVARNGWRDIASAPKDGTKFLAYSETNGLYDILRWVHADRGYQDHFESTRGYGGIPVAFLSLWQPLPAAPQASTTLLEDTKVIERLEAYAEQIAAGRGHFPTAARHLEEAASLIKTLREAVETEREECAKLIEEGFEREVGEQYLPDRRTKNDKCKHGRYMYEDCEQCAASAIRARSTQAAP